MRTGTSLRELRERHGMSLRDLQAATGINRGCLSQLENGKRVAELPHLLALSEALEVPLEAWRVRVVLEAVDA